jgi:hypothetical protein
MSLFYVTVRSAASTTPADLLNLFKPSQFKSLGAVQHGYLYRATDIVGNNVNSPIRTSAIRLLQHLQLLYLPSELDIDEQIQQVTLYFYCM